MKNYYYILGLNQTASLDEIKVAYRKLSLKFHPDKNDGDEFFSERFKEIHEAYNTLSDITKRKTYDELRLNSSTTQQSNSGTNFNPDIEFFKSNKHSFEYNEEITFSWKTINSDKVSIKPFGNVEPIGKKTYKIKDFKNPFLTFELIAENSNIGRQIKSKIKLENRTYTELYNHFNTIIKSEVVRNSSENNFQNSNNTEDNSESDREINFNKGSKSGELDSLTIKLARVFIGLIILGIFLLFSYRD